MVLRFLIFLTISLKLNAASILTTKTDVCQALMGTTVELSKKNFDLKETSKALKRLSEFKELYLLTPNNMTSRVKPSLKKVVAHENSSFNKKLKVARRIEGVLKQIENANRKQEKFEIYGLTLRNQEINELFDLVKNKIDSLKSENDYPLRYDLTNIGMLYTLSIVYQKYLNDQLLPIDYAILPIILWGGQFIFQGLTYPKEFFFLSDKRFNWSLKQIEKNHNKGHPVNWQYFSFDMKMNSKVTEEVLRRGDVSSFPSIVLNHFNKISVISKSYFASTFNDPEMLLKKWVSFDLLYQQEEFEGEIVPSLTVIMRIQNKKPKLTVTRSIEYLETERESPQLPDGSSLQL